MIRVTTKSIARHILFGDDFQPRTYARCSMRLSDTSVVNAITARFSIAVPEFLGPVQPPRRRLVPMCASHRLGSGGHPADLRN